VIDVKICGITRVEDAALAVELGARAIGLLFWPTSPRRVDRRLAKEIVAAVPANVCTVGVFVNQTDEAIEIAQDVGLNAIQLHGDETPDSYGEQARSHTRTGVSVIKAVAVRDKSALPAALAVPDSAHVLLDAHDAVKRGGTGRTIDWSLAAIIAAQRPVILSGGLNASNVLDAIAAVKPGAIDVSSGVESAPGLKDPDKLRALFDMLRQSSFTSSRPSAFSSRHSAGIGH
jgi:phosphoribosylanthranilate isomerase